MMTRRKFANLHAGYTIEHDRDGVYILRLRGRAICSRATLAELRTARRRHYLERKLKNFANWNLEAV